jgi:zinc transport system permease protein
MSDLLAPLSYEFIRNAVLAGLLASLLCGVIGTFVVVKRLAFISGGISHAAFAGLGVCYYFGLDPNFGAGVVAVLCAIGLGLLEDRQRRSNDALIGVMWAAGMAVGIVFLDRAPGYAPDLAAYLFGNILTVTRQDLAVTAALGVIVALILGLLFKEFVAVAFDEVFAAVQGVPVRLLTLLLLVMVALTVVMLIQVVGILLVLALLTIPPLVALMLVRGFFRVVGTSVATGAAMTLGGLALAYRYDLPPGPAIVLLGVAMMAAAYAVERLRGHTPRQLTVGRGR